MFESGFLTICYQVNSEEIESYSITSNNILLILSHPDIKISGGKINYLRKIKKIFSTDNILLRIQSECMLGIYSDSHCDCEEQRIFSDNNRQIVQNEISMSKLRLFFENNNFEFSKRVEMITTILE